jgi:tetratricopeptide (TPR) repeat protein
LDKAVDRLLQRVERGEHRGLRAEFERLLRKYPNYHMTNFGMGVYRGMVQGDPVGALPYFEKAVREFPLFAEGHFNLAMSCVKACHIPQAVASFRKAIQYTDDALIVGKANEQLAWLENTVRNTSPFKTLDAYIENQKLFDLAFANLRNRNFEKAIELFGKALEQNPEHVQSYGNLALAHAGLGHKAVALDCLDRALALDPSYEPAMVNRVAILNMAEGVPQGSVEVLETEYYRERLEAEHAAGG